MTSSDFSVLLLAWDDADPNVTVVGGSALPPTLPLVYELATQHPVVALYPHLPDASAAPAPAADAAAALAAPAPADPEFLPDPLVAAADGPGLRLLPAPTAAPAPASRSRLVGLDDLLPPTQAALASAHRQPSQFGSAPPAAGPASPLAGAAPAPAAPAAAGTGPGIRSQWPTPSGPAGRWQTPAAPYTGAASPPGPPILAAPAGGGGNAAVRAADSAPRHPDAQLLPPPPPRPPARPDPSAPASVFDETVAEMGAAEANDLDAPEDNLTLDDAPDALNGQLLAAPAAAAAPDAPAPAAPPHPAPASSAAARAEPAAEPAAAPAYVLRLPRLDGLNYRMIQYARQAMQLVAGHDDFGVIYAPAWPAWLAALEIRNRSGRPLVLYAASLPSDTAGPAERGWLLHVERMALRRARLVLVPDAAMQQQLRARHGADLGEVRLVPADDEATLQLVLAELALG